jgi:hypothetical protein
VYAGARLDALRTGMVALAIFVLVALFISVRLPATQPTEAAARAP